MQEVAAKIASPLMNCEVFVVFSMAEDELPFTAAYSAYNNSAKYSQLLGEK